MSILLITLFACDQPDDTQQDVESCAPAAAYTTACGSDDCTSLIFDAGPSTGDIASHTWDFGDGETAEGAVVEHTFDGSSQSYTVSLTLTGIDGQIANVEQTWVSCLEAGAPGAGQDAPIVYVAQTARWLPWKGSCEIGIESVGGCFTKPMQVDWSSDNTSSTTIYADFAVTSQGESYMLSNPTINYNFSTEISRSAPNDVDQWRRVQWLIADGESGTAEVLKPGSQSMCTFQFTCSANAPITNGFTGTDTDTAKGSTRYYTDRDRDGSGDPDTYVDAHTSPDIGDLIDFVDNGDDCDDTNSTLTRDCD